MHNQVRIVKELDIHLYRPTASSACFAGDPAFQELLVLACCWEIAIPPESLFCMCVCVCVCMCVYV